MTPNVKIEDLAGDQPTKPPTQHDTKPLLQLLP